MGLINQRQSFLPDYITQAYRENPRVIEILANFIGRLVYKGLVTR